MCFQSGRGRLEKRIFGNGVCSKNSADQILAGFVFAMRIGLGKESAIAGSETPA